MRGKGLGIFIGIVIYLAVAIWGVSIGYSIGVALAWPFGILLLALFGWAAMWRR